MRACEYFTSRQSTGRRRSDAFTSSNVRSLGRDATERRRTEAQLRERDTALARAMRFAVAGEESPLFQAVEYFRSFLLARLAFSRLDAVAIERCDVILYRRVRRRLVPRGGGKRHVGGVDVRVRIDERSVGFGAWCHVF